MATVLITEKLIRDTAALVAASFNKEIAEADKIPDHWYDMVYNAVYSKEHQQKMAELPKGFFSNYYHFSLTIRVTAEDNSHYLHLPQNVQSKDYLHAETPVFPGSGLKNLSTYSSQLVLEAPLLPSWTAFYQEFVAWRDKRAEIYTRRDALVETITTVLKGFSSLAPAIKACPAIWEFLPENIKSRHKQPQPKRERKAGIPDGVDLDGLTNLASTRALKRALGQEV